METWILGTPSIFWELEVSQPETEKLLPNLYKPGPNWILAKGSFVNNSKITKGLKKKVDKVKQAKSEV